MDGNHDYDSDADVELEEGESENEEEGHRNHPLDMRYIMLQACQDGDVDLIVRLLNTSQDVNCEDTTGWTPLLLTLSSGHHHIADMLYSRGARISTGGSLSAINVAIDGGHINSVQWVLRNSPSNMTDDEMMRVEAYSISKRDLQ